MQGSKRRQDGPDWCGCHPAKPNAGSILSQGTCLGCQLGPLLRGHVGEATNQHFSLKSVFLSYADISLSVSLPSPL